MKTGGVSTPTTTVSTYQLKRRIENMAARRKTEKGAHQKAQKKHKTKHRGAKITVRARKGRGERKRGVSLGSLRTV